MAGLKALIDPTRLAVARARFAAWWEGETFDEAAVMAKIAETLGAPSASGDGALELSPAVQAPPPPDARSAALETLWGSGRLFPGDDMEDQLQPARIGLPATGVLALFGAGLSQPAVAVGRAHPGPLRVFEWREEVRAYAKARLKASEVGDRATMADMDFDLFSAPADAWDGVLSFDEFSFAPNPSRLAVQMIKGLKPGAIAVVECYVARGDVDSRSAFASAFAEPHILEQPLLMHALEAAGLTLEAEEDLTAAHIKLAREGFRRFEQALRAEGEAQLTGEVLREIGWEAESWLRRVALLNGGGLNRIRLILRRPEDT